MTTTATNILSLSHPAAAVLHALAADSLVMTARELARATTFDRGALRPWLVYLLQHGQTAGPRCGYGITPAGRERLATLPPEAIAEWRLLKPWSFGRVFT